jgi:hypothetical protein
LFKLKLLFCGTIFISLLFIVLPFSFPTVIGKQQSGIRPLTIAANPPSLNFSTFMGGELFDYGYDVAIGSDSSYYITGITMSSDFPTEDAFDETLNGSSDAFVAKFTAEGSLLWSSFLGGNNEEGAVGIAVTNDGSCFVTGSTRSADFPILNAYYDTKSALDDVFVTKIAPNGSLLWSTLLGGNMNDYAHGIAVTTDGSCYITGETYSNDFPLLHAFDTSYKYGEAFVTKFASNGSLLWSTFLGGLESDIGNNIVVAKNDSCLITGSTASDDFPITDDNSNKGLAVDVFITGLAANGSLLMSTLLGGSAEDIGFDIAITNDNCFYVTGLTYSVNFPVKNGYSTAFSGGATDAFVTKYSLTGTLLWSSFLGGQAEDYAFGIAVAGDNSCFVSGYTESTDFPVLYAYDDSLVNFDVDIFISRFTSGGSLYWSSYFGGNDYEEVVGIAVAPDDSFVFIGSTYSTDFPSVNAYDDSNNGLTDVFLSRFNDDFIPPTNPQGLSAFGFLPFLFFFPIIHLLFRNKRKEGC